MVLYKAFRLKIHLCNSPVCVQYERISGTWLALMVFPVSLFQVVKINVCYWKEKVPGSYNVKQRFPCFLLTEFEETKDIYGLPSNEYPGLMKVCNSTEPSRIILFILYRVLVIILKVALFIFQCHSWVCFFSQYFDFIIQYYNLNQ